MCFLNFTPSSIAFFKTKDGNEREDTTSLCWKKVDDDNKMSSTRGTVLNWHSLLLGAHAGCCGTGVLVSGIYTTLIRYLSDKIKARHTDC